MDLEIFTAQAWLIDKGWVERNLPALVAAFKSGAISADLGQPKLPSYVSESKTFTEKPKTGSPIAAIIPVEGVMFKEKSKTQAAWVDNMTADPDITDIFLVFDTPGGQVGGVQTFAGAVARAAAKKNVYAITNDGIIASAGYWVASQATAIYAVQKLDSFGSIGVFTTVFDTTKMLDKIGINMIEIYAPESSEKNKEVRDLLGEESDPEAMEAQLSVIAQEFHSVVKAGRGDRLNLKAGDPFKGAMYYADQAKEIGLIDGIMSMSEIMEMAGSKSGASTGSANANKQSKIDNKNMSKTNAWTKLIAFLGFTASAVLTDEKLTAEQADKLEALVAENEQLKSEKNTLTASLASAEAAKATAEAAKTAAEGKVAGLEQQVATLTTERDEAVAKAKEYGSQSGAMGSQPTRDKDTIDGGNKNTHVDMNAEHNQYVKDKLGIGELK